MNDTTGQQEPQGRSISDGQTGLQRPDRGGQGQASLSTREGTIMGLSEEEVTGPQLHSGCEENGWGLKETAQDRCQHGPRRAAQHGTGI